MWPLLKSEGGKPLSSYWKAFAIDSSLIQCRIPGLFFSIIGNLDSWLRRHLFETLLMSQQNYFIYPCNHVFSHKCFPVKSWRQICLHWTVPSQTPPSTESQPATTSALFCSCFCCQQTCTVALVVHSSGISLTAYTWSCCGISNRSSSVLIIVISEITIRKYSPHGTHSVITKSDSCFCESYSWSFIELQYTKILSLSYNLRCHS